MVYLSKNLFDALSEFVAMPDPNTLSITIIPNLHRQTLQAMRDLGIFTIADLTEMTAADLDRLPRVGKATAQHIRQCVEALCQGEPLWLKAPDARAADDGIFFDVETDAMGEIWSIGWKAPSDAARCVVLDPNRLAEHRLLEDGTLVFTVPTRLAMWEMLHAVCVQHPSVPLYHWSPFEVGIVKKAGLPAPTAEISKRLLDLAKVVSQSVVLPIAKRRRGLKEVSSYLASAGPNIWPMAWVGGMLAIIMRRGLFMATWKLDLGLRLPTVRRGCDLPCVVMAAPAEPIVNYQHTQPPTLILSCFGRYGILYIVCDDD